MKTGYLLYCLFFLFSLSCTKQDPETAGSRIKIGDRLPEFTVCSAEGSFIESQDLHNKVVLIVFFSTGCSDCRVVLPVLEEIKNDLKDNHTFILLPIARKQTVDEIAGYWRENNFSMPYYPDESGSIYALFASATVPRFYLTDREGIIQWTETEKLTIGKQELKDKIRALL